MPKVSVVIPNYNHARFLRKRIESVLHQTFQDFEVILIDDCSTDDSRSVISQYAGDSRVRIEFNEVNSGNTFKQWNKGVRLARGKYVWIAESDDYADERLLERLVPLLDADPGLAFAYCRSWRVSEDGGNLGFVDSCLEYLDAHHWTSDFCVDGREECGKYFVFSNSVPNASAVVFRKFAYERVGGADETFRLCGDWIFWTAIALTGRIAYIAEPLNYFRFHSSSVRSNTAKIGVDKMESIRAVSWILSKVTPTESTLAKTREVHASIWVPLVMSLRVPLQVKRAIWRDVKAIDPHPARRIWRPVLVTIRLKLGRHWRDLRARFQPAASH